MVVATAKRTGIVGNAALLKAARDAAANAYAKYSGFHVGAAILTAAGNVYAGCNVENVSYPLGTCAEAAALAAARSAEGASFEPVAIAIYAQTSGGKQAPCSPCGGCRQRLLEFGPDMTVWFYDDALVLKNKTPRELLPHAFVF
jgi:cytidine deaminase